MAQFQPHHFSFTHSAGNRSEADQAYRVAGSIDIHPSRKSTFIQLW
jgi:hypothetical protein